ncbi:MAG: hypothetical protein M3P98_01030 [bacterium]|nr:hypothetical protein [bacterium]
MDNERTPQQDYDRWEQAAFVEKEYEERNERLMEYSEEKTKSNPITMNNNLPSVKIDFTQYAEEKHDHIVEMSSLSECCGAPCDDDILICSACKEHCDLQDDNELPI